MNCAIHSQTPAVGYCRTCGKALCEECKREVRGVIYCEECIAARVLGTLPAAVPGTPAAAPTVVQPVPSGGPNLVAATLLGFIPGVGAMYNGQFMKGFIHVLIFASLVWAAGRSDFFGFFIAFFVFYMVFDAYRTAKALQMGAPLPDPFGLGGGVITPAAGAPPGAPAQTARSPVAAFILIGMGVLFLLDNMGLFRFHWIGRLWPLILIAVGIHLFMRRSGRW